MDALVFEEGAVLQHALNKGRKVLEENEKLVKAVTELSYENSELSDRLDNLGDTLEEQENTILGYRTRCIELENECKKLRKEVKEAWKERDDFKYHEIICPGEAARYYLEKYRELKVDNKNLRIQVKSMSDFMVSQENEIQEKDREIARLQELLIKGETSREEHTP